MTKYKKLSNFITASVWVKKNGHLFKNYIKDSKFKFRVADATIFYFI